MSRMLNQENGSKLGGNTALPVTVIGLGPMGQALANAFLKNNHPITVWNRTSEKAKNLVERGAVLAESITDAIAANPLIIICVLDYGVANKILKPVVEALKGRTLVNLTADSPQYAREMAAWAAEYGIDYIDGSIMTPAVTIGESTASVLYSGSEGVYLKHQSTLNSLGGLATFLGADPGRAVAYDVALLDFFWTAMSGYTHSLALAAAENISAKELAHFAKGIVDILPNIIEELALEVDNQQYVGDDSSLISNVAGMDHIIHVSKEHGLDTSVLSAARSIAQRAVEAGHGTDGYSRLVEMLGRQRVQK